MTAPPRTILLATDLSHRSDRALDRAVRLAQEWGARLVALTVVDRMQAGFGNADAATAQRIAERHLHADAAGAGVAVHVRIEHGAVAERVLDVARQEDCGLIVLGVAHREALSRAVLGSTVDRLCGRAPVPLLVVRQRARAAYGAIVVASDFSDAAAHALRAADALFPTPPLWLFHAFASPYPLRADIDPERTHEDGFRLARQQAEAHLLSSGLAPPRRARLKLLMQHGDPAVLLEARGQAHPEELVVFGAKGRSRMMNLLLGSHAQRILERAETDVLIVGGSEAD